MAAKKIVGKTPTTSKKPTMPMKPKMACGGKKK